MATDPMSDVTEAEHHKPVHARGPLFYIGAVATLGMMATDTIAVIGRHVRLPLLGSIEVVQACILLAASAAMVSATLLRSHAEVHVVTSRVSPAMRASLKRMSDLVSGLFFLAVAAGSIWLLWDLWDGHEQSELLGIPFIPLRLIALASMAAIAIIFLLRAIRPNRKDAQ